MSKEIKPMRSRWLHPDDIDVVRRFVDKLNEDRGRTLDNAAVRFTNNCQYSYVVEDIEIVVGRSADQRVRPTWAGKGRLCSPGKKHVITRDQARDAGASNV